MSEILILVGYQMVIIGIVVLLLTFRSYVKTQGERDQKRVAVAKARRGWTDPTDERAVKVKKRDF